MKRSRLLLLTALLVLPTAVLATPTQCLTDQAKGNFLKGSFQVPAAACTAAGAPSACCTGAGAGANCPTYKIAMVLDASTAGCSTTTWSSISANEVSGTGYTAGGNTLTAANYTISTSSNHACVQWGASTSWSSSTIASAKAAVVYCATNCPTLDVVSINCLDGSSCATAYSSSNGTFTINFPTGAGTGLQCIN